MMPTRKLPRRAQLATGEAWPSLRHRNVREMSHDTLGIHDSYARSVLAAHGLTDNLDRPSHAKTYDILAELTGLDVLSIYRSTVHSFSHTVTPPESETRAVVLGGTAYPLLKQLRPSIASEWDTQICPACLRKNPYSRLIWAPLASTVCLEHACMLVRRCPSCGSPISIEDAVTARCKKCQCDLAHVDAFSIKNDEFGLNSQAIIQSLLVNQGDPFTLHPALPSTDSRVIFRLIEGLRFVIESIGTDWSYVHPGIAPAHCQAPNTFSLFRFYATAVKAILEWPNSFTEFLESLVYRADRGLSLELRVDFGGLYTHCLERYWMAPGFAFVQQAFEQFIVDHYPACRSVFRMRRYRESEAFVASIPYIGASEAADRLAISTSQVYDLLTVGALSRYSQSPEDTSQNDHLLVRKEILGLQKAWAHAITLKEASKLLGLDSRQVLRLAEKGYLRTAYKPTNGGRLTRVFHKKQVQDLFERVESCTQPADDYSEVPIDLKSASIRLTRWNLDPSLLFQWILDKKLPPYRLLPSNLRLADLHFKQQDLTACLERASDTIAIETAARIIKADRKTVQYWVNSGLLASLSEGNQQYVFRRDAERFRSKFVGISEAAQVLGISETTMGRWVMSSRISPVNPSNGDKQHERLFDKSFLIEWKASRVNATEACSLLGINADKLKYWVNKRYLKPLEDMKGRVRWFARKAVIELRQNSLGDGADPPVE